MLQSALLRIGTAKLHLPLDIFLEPKELIIYLCQKGAYDLPKMRQHFCPLTSSSVPCKLGRSIKLLVKARAVLHNSMDSGVTNVRDHPS